MSFLVPIVLSIFGMATDIELFEAFCYAHQNMTRFFFAFQLNFASFVVKKRFELLNNHLKKIIRLNLRNFQFKSFKASEYSQLYHKLCNAIDIINDNFTFQFTIIFPVLTVNFPEILTFNFSLMMFFLGFKHFCSIWCCE